jgi:hypothetical protein
MTAFIFFFLPVWMCEKWNSGLFTHEPLKVTREDDGMQQRFVIATLRQQ